MAEKLGSGVIWEGPPRDDVLDVEEDAIALARKKRDASRGAIGLGVGLMFLGSFSTAIAVGGALSVGLGIIGAVWHGRKLRQLEGDPWDPDPELDAWERDLLDDELDDISEREP